MQKVRIAGQRTLYISVHDDAQPAELFCHVKWPGCTTEGIVVNRDVPTGLVDCESHYNRTTGESAAVGRVPFAR